MAVELDARSSCHRRPPRSAGADVGVQRPHTPGHCSFLVPPRRRAQRMTVTRPSDKSGHERSRSATACRSAFASSCGRCTARTRAIRSLSDARIGIIEFMGIVIGPIRRGDGIAPAVALVDPKFPHNVGAAVRAASCYGVRQVWFSGDRVRLDGAKRQRLPREERMRGYKKSRSGTRISSSTRSRMRSRWPSSCGGMPNR